jgi:hypothetical protein
MTFLGSPGEISLGIWLISGAVLSTLTLTASPRSIEVSTSDVES